MIRYRCLNNIILICLILATSGLVGCQSTNPVPQNLPTMVATPTAAAPTVEVIVTHPELQVLTPDNIGRLKQIDQWGQGRVNGIALSPGGSRIAVSTVMAPFMCGG